MCNMNYRVAKRFPSTSNQRAAHLPSLFIRLLLLFVAQPPQRNSIHMHTLRLHTVTVSFSYMLSELYVLLAETILSNGIFMCYKAHVCECKYIFHHIKWYNTKFMVNMSH